MDTSPIKMSAERRIQVKILEYPRPEFQNWNIHINRKTRNEYKAEIFEAVTTHTRNYITRKLREKYDLCV